MSALRPTRSAFGAICLALALALTLGLLASAGHARGAEPELSESSSVAAVAAVAAVAEVANRSGLLDESGLAPLPGARRLALSFHA